MNVVVSSTNKIVDKINQFKLDMIDAQATVFNAKFSVNKPET